MHIQLQGLVSVLSIAQMLHYIRDLEPVHPSSLKVELLLEFEQKVMGRLERPSLEAFLGTCSSKLAMRAILTLRESNSSWK